MIIIMIIVMMIIIITMLGESCHSHGYKWLRITLGLNDNNDLTFLDAIVVGGTKAKKEEL